MEVEVIGVMIPIILTVGAYIMIIYIRKFENLERMAIIEKGLDPAIFKKESAAAPTLRWALLFIGAGIGLLLAYFLDRAWNMQEVAYFSMVLIFGGAGLATAYVIEEKKMREKANR